MTGVGVPGVFPVGGRRLVVYVVFDRRGGVDDYVAFALAGLRDHADRVLVVVNGSLTDEGRAKLEPLSDEILVRPNVGFDIWAHKDALDHVGASIEEFDEVVLTNDTWFGPVRPFAPVFAEMDARPVHFWGLTDHAREEPNPFTGKGCCRITCSRFGLRCVGRCSCRRHGAPIGGTFLRCRRITTRC